MPPRHTDGPPPERSFWELLPRRNFRRVVFLILVLFAVVALKRSSGRSLHGLVETLLPPPPPPSAKAAPAPFQRLEVVPAPGAGGAHP